MRQHVMFDLETLGRSSRAAIVQIGACSFDPGTGEIGGRFSVNVDLKSSLDAGLEVDAEAIRFWMIQRPEAKTWLDAVDAEGRPGCLGRAPLFFSLGAFGDFLSGDLKETPIWSHVTFDVPIIASAFAAVKMPLPFRYQDCRDLRTLIELAGYERPSHNGIPHDALSDCEHQVRYCVEAMKKLREK